MKILKTMIKGELLYEKIEKKIGILDRMYTVPTFLEIPKRNHKEFFDYLEKNPNKRGNVREFNQVEISGTLLEIIPVESLDKKDEDGDVVEKVEYKLS